MARSSSTKRGAKRAIAFSAWLYALFLCIYPARFRRAYGSRMVRVFRDSCRDALQCRGFAGLSKFWLHTFFDLLLNAVLEGWQVLKEGARAMTGYREARNFPLRLWVALVTTALAFAVSLVTSLNLYLLEDTSQFTQAAYNASPLLRFSYDVIYLSALAAGVAICAIIGFALVRCERLVVIGLVVLALLIALGGFGGLMFRHFPTFLALFGIFVVLTLASFLLGRAVARRFGPRIGPRPATIFGACVSAGSLLLVNVVALIIHTIILNPASHELYMQGQIPGTHFNFALIAMAVAFLTLIVCIASLGSALRLPVRQA